MEFESEMKQQILVRGMFLSIMNKNIHRIDHFWECKQRVCLELNVINHPQTAVVLININGKTSAVQFTEISS